MTITMRSLAAAALLCLGALAGPQAHAQTFVVASCPSVTAVGGAGQKGLPYAIDTKGNICSSSAGGSGGLSVTDQATWTQAVSAFTPGGCTFNDAATLTSGLQGTFRCNSVRGLIVATDAANPLSVTAIGVAQGSTTSGQTGSLVMGAVTTAAPTYTTAQTSPMSLTTAGAQRIDEYSRAGTPLVADPCQTVAKTFTPISITTATTTRIIAPTSAKKTYICYMFLKTTAANNIAVVEGTGGTCGSGTAGIVGGTTAANGLNDAANDGQAFGTGGFAVLATAGTNVDLCLITSAATPLAGHVAWVAQ